MIKVEVGSSQIGDLAKKLEKPQDLLNSIGDYLVKTTQARIRTTKSSPDGAPWAPWAPSTYLARAKQGSLGGGLLYNTGSLFNSISHSVSGDKVEVGTSSPFAKYLQMGTQRMPARPFLGISPADQEAITGLVRRHLTA